MIDYIKGNLTYKADNFVVAENNGIGFKVFVPSNSKLYCTEQNQEVIIYTVMVVREDDISVYGFEDRASLELFNKLTTVNGIGAKAAMSIFSAMSCEQIKKAIVFEDVTALTKANGIGKKSAQRIILDLKDKFSSEEYMGSSKDDNLYTVYSDSNGTKDTKREAVEALVGLGFTQSEAMDKIAGISGKNITTEEYIKIALTKF